MKNTLKTFKWWWSWKPEIIEDYLEAMAMQGWSLVDVGSGMTTFYFEASQPQKMRYCVDFNPNVTGDYITLLGDDQWQLVGQQIGWLLWQKPYDNQRPQVFTDPDALIHRNHQLMKLLIVLIAIQLINIIIQFAHMGFQGFVTDYAKLSLVLVVVLTVFISLGIFGILKIHQHNKRLRS